MFIAPANHRRGFTLLEIMLAVGILAMMSLGIYRFVQANITSMRLSAAADATDAQYEGLRELLKIDLGSLAPGSGSLLGDALKVGDQERDEITWIAGAGPSVVTRYASRDYKVSLRLRALGAKSNQLDLGLLRKPKNDPAISNAHETWVRLIENVKSLEIRYFDARLNVWVPRWTDTASLPRLVKFTIDRSDGIAPLEMIIPLMRAPQQQ
ncbi:MAG: prepilin-type N-terminal cleavage/methylation domain-containing protein [Verrucomicrobiota bacterium]|nr:prepilin-type N-terminal cleavage/methylation domain-containing protein [Verrucomicrobiota bacterium]